MPLSPMTRYYVRRLLQKHADELGLSMAVSGSMEDSDDSSFFDQFMRLESLASTKLAELDLVVRLHQSLSRNGHGYRAYLQNLEAKLFSLMGLSLKQTEAGAEPTLPLSVPYSLNAYDAPSMSLAEALEQLNLMSDTAKKYLGGLITRNYWHATRPASSWCVDIEISPLAEVTMRTNRPPQEIWLSAEQRDLLQAWANHFCQQCQRVLPQFRRMLAKDAKEISLLVESQG